MFSTSVSWAEKFTRDYNIYCYILIGICDQYIIQFKIHEGEEN